MPLFATSFEPGANYSVCFTPGGACTDQIVQAIDQAQQSIYVQAYSFTSKPIIKALVRAQQRHISVKVILDKSNLTADNHLAAYLAHQQIPVWIDDRVNIAHNKVMVIDADLVITGSFNFTRAAQAKNAENVLIIHDATLAQAYLANWQRRQGQAYTFINHGDVKISFPESRAQQFEDWLTQIGKWLHISR